MSWDIPDMLGLRDGGESLVPNRFLFEFEIPLRRRADFDELEKRGVAGFVDAERLPLLGELDEEPAFADVWACWSEIGLAVGCHVRGKSRTLKCDAKDLDASDGLWICVDTRGSRDLRRANRFCRRFLVMPRGGGSKGDAPVVRSPVFQRSKEDAPEIRLDDIRVRSEIASKGYALLVVIPAAALPGFDPLEHPRIGFYCMIQDRQFGTQCLTVGDEFQWDIDPSTWATAVLAR